MIALGRLGWSLRRIQKQTGIRRETAGEYLREAGIEVRPPGAWGRRSPAKPANEVTTDSGPKPANEVTTDSEAVPAPAPIASASICEPFGDMIEVAVSAGRNAMSIWQDLVDKCGFTGSYQSAKRFVGKLRGPTQEACGVNRHRARRRNTGGLWQWPDGAPSADGQVSAHAPLRVHAGLHASTPACFDRVANVLRITWNVAQPRPCFSSSGSMLRLQMLSRRIGVAGFSDGNNHAVG